MYISLRAIGFAGRFLAASPVWLCGAETELYLGMTPMLGREVYRNITVSSPQTIQKPWEERMVRRVRAMVLPRKTASRTHVFQPGRVRSIAPTI
jgi:hypothetical protein